MEIRRYKWCLHCERTYIAGVHRLIGGLKMCPYEGCDGDTVIDSWAWNKVRLENPAYPAVPEWGVMYPMYGQCSNPEKRRYCKGCFFVGVCFAVRKAA